VIKLHTFPQAFGLRNVSPFCLKVEMALVHLKQEFDIIEESDPRKAPKGKLPYLLIDGAKMPDSELILEYLDKKTNGGLYGGLNSLEMAQGTAFTRLAEDHLYWMVVASRWLDEDWFPNIREGFFSYLPTPMKYLVGMIARRQVRQTYNLHGLGRHTLQEQKHFAQRDLQAIADVVSEQHYIVGGRLTAFDFSVASLLAGAIDNKPATWVTELAENIPALREYAERIQQEVGVYCRAS
jgi:glutathione S-transferase